MDGQGAFQGQSLNNLRRPHAQARDCTGNQLSLTGTNAAVTSILSSEIPRSESPTSLASLYSPLIDNSSPEAAAKDGSARSHSRASIKRHRSMRSPRCLINFRNVWYWMLMECFPCEAPFNKLPSVSMNSILIPSVVTGKHGNDDVCSKGTRR